MNKYIASCGKTELCKLLIEMALIRNMEVRGKEDPLLAMAGRYKVNVKAIEKKVKETNTKTKVQTSAKKERKGNVNTKSRTGDNTGKDHRSD